MIAGLGIARLEPGINYLNKVVPWWPEADFEWFVSAEAVFFVAGVSGAGLTDQSG